MFWFAILFLSSTAAHMFRQEESTTTIHPEILVKRYQLECVEETRVDPDAIASIKKQKWNMQYSRLELVKDWALCVLMKSGVMSAEGVYRMDVAMQRVPLHARYVVESQIDACLTQKAMPAKDIAYVFIRCFQRMNSEYTALVSVII